MDINGKDFCWLTGGNYYSIDMKNNYWGTTDTNIINGANYDYNDDIKIGAKVDYSGFASLPYSSSCGIEGKVKGLADKDQLLTIFPNPASETVSLKINMSGEKTIKLMDAKGSILFTESTLLNDFSFSANAIDPGFYFIEVNQNETHVFKKLIIK